MVANTPKDFPKDIVKHVNAIPPGMFGLSDEEQYQFMVLWGERIYQLGAPLWCKYDSLTKEEFARLLSGMLPATDPKGGFFDQLYWSDAEKYPVGTKHAIFSLFTIFTNNFKCLKHVREILSRSSIGDSAAPKLLAEYARSKGLLPHDGVFGTIDNSPLLSLLNPSNSDVLTAQSDDELSIQSESGLPYSTKWLIIQNAAIMEFFNPRRNPDAKKDEVVQWIMLKAASVGLKASKQIGEAIFTIIKPSNHNPRKKRGEPL